MKPTCRILWAGNLLIADLTFGPSFKVKRWFTGFGELFFRWIQICIGSLKRRSSLTFLFLDFGTLEEYTSVWHVTKSSFLYYICNT